MSVNIVKTRKHNDFLALLLLSTDPSFSAIKRSPKIHQTLYTPQACYFPLKLSHITKLTPTSYYRAPGNQQHADALSHSRHGGAGIPGAPRPDRPLGLATRDRLQWWRHRRPRPILPASGRNATAPLGQLAGGTAAYRPL